MIFDFIKKILKRIDIYILLLIFIAVITHLEWFSPFSLLFSWDWKCWSSEAIKNLFPFGQGTYINFFDFGFQNIQIYFNSFLVLWGIIGNYIIASKLTIMIPIAFLSILSPYFLIKHLVGSKKIAFISALFFSFSTVLLYLELSHLLIAFVFSLSPLILLFFIKLLEKFNVKNLITFAWMYTFGICYEIRIMYILSFVLLIYFIIFFKRNFFLKNKLKYIILFFVVFFLNMFWFLPAFFSDKMAIEKVAARDLFGEQFSNLLNSFTNYNVFWSGSEVTGFLIQPIPFYVWIIPVFILSLFLIKERIKKIDRKFIVFFGVLLLLGIFLTKQSSEPFPKVYQWLYDNFPGFNLFRVASKFFLLVLISYLGLFAYSLKYLVIENKKINKYFKNLILIFFSLLFLWNAKPLITGEVGHLFVKKIEPLEYKILNNFMSEQKDFFRTIWFPGASKWGYFNIDKPRISSVSIMEGEYKNFYSNVRREKYYANFIFKPFEQNYGNCLANISGIKYFIVPMRDEQNNVYKYYGSNYKNYADRIQHICFLEEVLLDGLGDIKLYENKNYKPHIFSDIGLNYIHANVSEFGNFSENQNLYLNVAIEEHKYLLDSLDNIIIPVEADQKKIKEIELSIDKIKDPQEKKKLKSNLDLYINLFLEDFKLKIPKEAVYNIYIRKDSVLSNNENISIKIDDCLLGQNEKGINKEEWSYFNQMELNKGNYNFEIYVDDKKINSINAEDVVLSAENLVEPIATPQLEYRQINPTKYIINVYGANGSFPLIFAESFHPEWKIYINQSINDNQGPEFISENNQGTIQNENLDSGNFYDIFFRKPVFNNKHFTINNFANSWWIDIDEIKDSRIQGLKNYVENADGSIDFSIIIEFEPQKYFYGGLLISGMTFLGCVGYLIYDYSKRRKKKISN